MHISVVMPLRWLAGNTHELANFEWGPMSMGRAIDTLHQKMSELSISSELIIDRNFMMDMFLEYRNELPPMEEYWEFMFKKKQMSIVARRSGTKVVQYARICDQLFDPTRTTHKATTKRMIVLAKIAADAIITELEDKKKATHKYLSRFGSNFSWEHCPGEQKKALLGKSATNDEAESTLGSATAHVQQFKTIHLSGAAAVGAASRNCIFDSFDLLDEKLQEAILLISMKDAPSTRAGNNNDIESQAKTRREKEELKKDIAIENATSNYIDAVHYCHMYSSPACWKGDPKVVQRNLTSMNCPQRQHG